MTRTRSCRLLRLFYDAQRIQRKHSGALVLQAFILNVGIYNPEKFGYEHASSHMEDTIPILVRSPDPPIQTLNC